jgi:fatty-acyl-CoA synthase
MGAGAARMIQQSMSNGLSLLSVLRASADHFEDKPAFVSPERSVGYRDFCSNVGRIAAHLRQLGLLPGARVAVLDVDGTEYLEIFYGIGVAGLVVVPLNYRQRLEELAFQIEDSDARLLIAGTQYRTQAETLGASVEFGWTSLQALHTEATATACDTSDIEPSDPHAAFAICYTSGTTGRPKGATISQHVTCLRALKFVAEFGLTSDDVLHVTPPLFHISGVVLNLVGFVRGCSVLILPQFRFAETLALMHHYRVTCVCLVPTILAMMRNAPEFGPAIFGSLRIILYAGSPMSPQLIRDIMSVYQGDMIQSFGQTEDLPQLILNAQHHRAAFAAEAPALHSIGKPAIGVEIKISDGKGRPVPKGEIGEIASRGGTAMLGYWNLPDATASTIVDGWVHSGDLGYIGTDGFVYLAGRKKQMIIRGGENVYPAEVERVLLEAPGVKDAVVLGMPDPVWGEIVVAVVVADTGTTDEAALIAFCRTRLASYRCPEQVIFRDELTYNAGGKVDRSQLRQEIESWHAREK